MGGYAVSNVYLVTQGEYSDYHVMGVYSTEENAELAVKHFGGTIEEFALDPDIEQMHAGRKRYWVKMERDGTVREYAEGQSTEEFAFWGDYRGAVNLELSVWARSKEHAVKITSEVRRQLLAADAWPERVNSIPYEARKKVTTMLRQLTAEVAEAVGAE